ncbi:hypothetical protein [Streptomyces sp. NPDC059639]|uniref:hypothetical protein n=1 Tax=Streptomyces sp. NPDC059639 TaxID=3346891 RepID=UPI0036BB1756
MGLNGSEECQFILHSNCNASYDMVPAWVNPVVVLALVVSLVGLVRFAVARWPLSRAMNDTSAT